MTEGSSSRRDSVDIYRIRLDIPETRWAELTAQLTEPERARADRFLPANKRREFTITRAALRRILSQTLNEQACRISIIHQQQGKPCLDGSKHGHEIRFSVSHSHDVALVAVARNRDIGIDVEKIRDDIEHETLAQRFFSESEFTALRHYDGCERLRAFFAVWTRKEAVVKAQGGGIALGLKQFDVSVDPDTAPRVLASRWQQPGIPEWALADIDAGPGYAACLAVNGNIPPIILHEIN